MPDFEDSLGAAFRQATESVRPDRPLRLVSEAHAEGRRTRRRRKAAMVSTAAAVAIAVAVGGTLVATSGSKGRPADTIVANPPTPPSAREARYAQMSSALTALLTPGTLTGIHPANSMTGTQRYPGPSAGVAARFTDSRGTAVVSVHVTRKPAGARPSASVCAPAGSAGSDGPCHVATWKDGRVIVFQGIHPAPEDWLMSYYETTGYQVQVAQDWSVKPGRHSGPPKTGAPLSAAQLASIAESDLWRAVAAGMPVPPMSTPSPVDTTTPRP